MVSELTYYQHLKQLLSSLYSLNYGYQVKTRILYDNEYLFLYHDTKLTFIVRLIINTKPLTKSEVVNEINELRRIGKDYKCFASRIISTSGFRKSCHSLDQFTTILSDESYIEGLKIKGFPFELFPHNEISYQKMGEGFEVSNKVAIVQATGTGKSVLIAKFIYDNPDKNVVLLSPNNFIFKQLKKFIKSENVHYITYAKASKLKAKEIKDLKADIIIIDEYHRMGAEVWGSGTQALIDFYKEKQLLGTTATPGRTDGRNMADEIFDGHVVVNISLAKAIKELIVPAPYYVSALYTLDEEAEQLKRKILASNSDQKEHLIERLLVAKSNWEKSKGVPQILDKHIPEEASKMIVFCSSIDEIDNIKSLTIEWFKSAGFSVGQCLVAHSKLNNNKEVLDEFESYHGNELILLFAVDMLNEGVHIEGVDGVMFLRKTESHIVYFQQMGRGITVDFSKKPLVIDLVNNFQSSSSFKSKIEGELTYEGIDSELLELDYGLTIVDEVKDINDLFDSITNDIESYSVFLKKCITFKEKHEILWIPNVYPEDPWFGRKASNVRSLYQNGNLKPSLVKDLNELGFIWNNYDYERNKVLDELEDFVSQNSSFDIPYTSPLRSKLYNFRRAYRKGRLTEHQINRFNQIGFGWDTDYTIRQYGLDRYIKDLKTYKKINGDLRITTYNAPNSKFYTVTKNILSLYADDALDPDIVTELNNLGFNWNPDTESYFWDTFCDLLAKYVKLNNTTSITRKNCDNEWLVSKMSTVKTKYRKGELSNEVVIRLNQIGFDSRNNREIRLDDQVDRIKKFYDEFGHFDVPRNYSDKSLHTLIVRIRKQKRDGVLLDDTAKKLDNIGFEWTGVYDRANQTFVDKLLQFKKTNGHFIVFNEKIAGDRWFYRRFRQLQEIFNKGGKIPEYIKLKLEEVEFPFEYWLSSDNYFYEFFALLEIFKAEFGHCDVPDSPRSKYAMLASRKSTIRRRYRKGNLKEYQIKKLEELGFNCTIDQVLNKQVRVDQAIELLNKGLSKKEIASELNLSKSSVDKYLVGIKRQKFVQRKKQAIELFNQGLSRKDIASELNLAQSTVDGYLIGSPNPNSRQVIQEQRKKQAIELFNQGLSRKEIASELNVTKETVSRYLR